MKEKIYCHASCCSGETDITYLPEINEHTAQSYLDIMGYPYGFFGERTEQVLNLIMEIINENNIK